MRKFEVATDDGLAGGYLLIDPDLSEPGEIAIRLCFVDAPHVTVFVMEDDLRDHLRYQEPWMGTTKGLFLFDWRDDDLKVSLNSGSWLAHIIDHRGCLNYLAELCGA